MVAATLGYNDLVVTLGVFEDEATARKVLIEMGCEEAIRPGIRRIFTTPAFCERLEKMGFSAYSTSIPLDERFAWWFRFIPCQLNEIYTGYNDD